MLPWKNSWFQLALIAAALSLSALVADIFKLPVIGGGGGGTSSSQGNQAQNNPPPAPGNLPPQDQNAFTNSLGMKFVPAGTSGVLFCIWDTRVQDFQQFINQSGYTIPNGIGEVDTNGKLEQYANNNWYNAGISQTVDSPVMGVSWDDANAFCQWLTQAEQKSGKISSQQVYRLPTDAEWSAAAGSMLYPYGSNYPPPGNAGNFFRKGDSSDWAKLDIPLVDTDGYANTSPVGSYPPNAYGLFDMGGNVYQWTSDWFTTGMNASDVNATYKFTDGGGQAFRVLRGSSWWNCDELSLRTQVRWPEAPGVREEDIGFRCVLTTATSPWITYLEIGIGLAVVAGAYFYFKGGKKTDETQAAA